MILCLKFPHPFDIRSKSLDLLGVTPVDVSECLLKVEHEFLLNLPLFLELSLAEREVVATLIADAPLGHELGQGVFSSHVQPLKVEL